MFPGGSQDVLACGSPSPPAGAAASGRVPMQKKESSSSWEAKGWRSKGDCLQIRKIYENPSNWHRTDAAMAGFPVSLDHWKSNILL